MSSDFLKAREQRGREDDLFEARARRFRPYVARTAMTGQPVPTHHREERPTPAQLAAQRERDYALLRRLEASRPLEQRQATLDRRTSERAQAEFAGLPVEVQVRLLQGVGVAIERPIIEPVQEENEVEE